MRQLTERGEGDNLILGVPDPELSPTADGGELRCGGCALVAVGELPTELIEQVPKS
jgi:hypothetical protein